MSAAAGAAAADPPEAARIAPLVAAADFERAIASKGLVVVDFSATWCGPCRMLAPELEAVARDHPDSVRIVTVDVDRFPELAARFKVTALPTLMSFRDGQPVSQLLGFHDADALAKWLGLGTTG
ncbi:MAG: thioredoxin [Planctomycetes bacterium]|nr:thioredoxin [Planctomycetota bacterium]